MAAWRQYDEQDTSSVLRHRKAVTEPRYDPWVARIPV